MTSLRSIAMMVLNRGNGVRFIDADLNDLRRAYQSLVAEPVDHGLGFNLCCPAILRVSWATSNKSDEMICLSLPPFRIEPFEQPRSSGKEQLLTPHLGHLEFIKFLLISVSAHALELS